MRRERGISAGGDLCIQSFGDAEYVAGIVGAAQTVKHQHDPEICCIDLCHIYKVTQQIKFYK